MADRLTSRRHLRRFALGLAVLTLAVVVLGAWVRLTGAGLGCPDWPGCYGRMVVGPDGTGFGASGDGGKAWREMVHRYFAAILGLGILLLAIVAVRDRRRTGGGPLALPIALLVLTAFQAVLGAWTVTLRLQPAVVVAHLLGGLVILGGLWRLYLGPPPAADRAQLARPSPRAPRPIAAGADSLGPVGGIPESFDGAAPALPSASSDPRDPPPRSLGARVDSFVETRRGPDQPRGPSRLRRAVVAGVIVLTVQIALGGWTSANYAAFACPDFPACQGAWWPDADYAMGFRLWQESGSGFEGGVLDSRARTAIHLVHRLGAAVTVLYLAGLCGAILWRARGGGDRGVVAAALSVLGLLLAQASLGVSTVWLGLPLGVAVAHNAGAALLLLALLTMHHRLG